MFLEATTKNYKRLLKMNDLYGEEGGETKYGILSKLGEDGLDVHALVSLWQHAGQRGGLTRRLGILQFSSIN